MAKAWLLAGGAGLVLAASGFASPAIAQEVSEVDLLRAEVEELRELEREARARVETLEARLVLLESLLGPVGSPLANDEQAVLTGRGLAGAGRLAVQQTPPPQDSDTVEPPPLAQSADGERKDAAPSEAVETVTREVQNNYGARFSLEPGLTYTHSTNAALNLSGFLALDAIFLGRFSIDEVKSDTVTADLTARLGGLVPGVNFNVNIPYLFRRSSYTSGGAGASATALSSETVTQNGLGDISAGISYRVMGETRRRPDLVLLGRIKAPTGKNPFGIEPIEVEGSEGNLIIPTELPTGSGVWGASLGVSALKTIDPLVVFGNVTYFHNFPASFDDISDEEELQPGEARLGNALQYGGGVAFALNETTSLTFSFSQRFVDQTSLRFDPTEDNPEPNPDFTPIVGSSANVAALNIGAGFSLSDRLSLLFNIGAGLSEDAPDMSVGIRLPARF